MPDLLPVLFGMFGGREEKVNLEFENHLVGVMIDRFGQDIMIMSKDNEHSVHQGTGECKYTVLWLACCPWK